MRFFTSLLGAKSASLGLLTIALAPSLAAESLASRFSSRFAELRSEVERIDIELFGLPDIPKDDSGGTDAYARYFAAVGDRREFDVDSAISFIWSKPATVDFVALIPSRSYTSYGLDLEYGFPDDYRISLLDDKGEAVALIADVRSTSALPSGSGLPFVHELKEPIEASGIEVRVTRLRSEIKGGPTFHFFSLAEVFCFSGEKNLMRNSEISFNYDETANASPYWSAGFMTDEITPLGLPEQPLEGRETWKKIGWISDGKESDTTPVSVTIDLGEAKRIDGFRMFPAIRPSLVTFPGFGVPQRYRIEGSMSGLPNSFTTIVPPKLANLPNPGNNPITHYFPPTEARFVRIRSHRLWKPFQHYPAFLAFSEIQILNKEANIAMDAAVIPSENPTPFAAEGDHYWSKESLTDGHGPTGKIVPRKTWLQQLGKRKSLEISRASHLAEMANIEASWQRRTATTLSIVGLCGLLAIIFLPVRFRLRERRKIRLIRDRIAGDLHDDVGSNLGSIQLLAGSAQSKSDNAYELNLINQVAAETVTSVRDIVWLLRPRSGPRISTISHLRESASFLLESLDWSLQTDLEDFELNDTDSRNLVLFFREALHNLVRHSKAKVVNIHIRRNESQLILEIADDGCGIAPELLTKEATLRALKQRSKNLNGELAIESGEGKGTLLRLSFVPKPVTSKRSLRYPFPDLGKD